MAFFPRTAVSRGWLPDADASNAPPDAVLRADNLTLDELGVLAVRQGSAIAATLNDLDVHSLYTEVLNSTRYRMAAAGDTVYANGSAIQTRMLGAGLDVAFGGHLGQ